MQVEAVAHLTVGLMVQEELVVVVLAQVMDQGMVQMDWVEVVEERKVRPVLLLQRQVVVVLPQKQIQF
jgi:hypothetical protein